MRIATTGRRAIIAIASIVAPSAIVRPIVPGIVPAIVAVPAPSPAPAEAPAWTIVPGIVVPRIIPGIVPRIIGIAKTVEAPFRHIARGKSPFCGGKSLRFILFCVILHAVMKYFEVTFCVSPYSEDACDILSASLADSGFETFVPTEQGITAYVQQALFDESALKGHDRTISPCTRLHHSI